METEVSAEPSCSEPAEAKLPRELNAAICIAKKWDLDPGPTLDRQRIPGSFPQHGAGQGCSPRGGAGLGSPCCRSPPATAAPQPCMAGAGLPRGVSCSSSLATGTRLNNDGSRDALWHGRGAGLGTHLGGGLGSPGTSLTPAGPKGAGGLGAPPSHSSAGISAATSKGDSLCQPSRGGTWVLQSHERTLPQLLASRVPALSRLPPQLPLRRDLLLPGPRMADGNGDWGPARAGVSLLKVAGTPREGETWG